VDIDLEQLPIPDWGLQCPGCGYPLRGLPSHRCPECGLRISIRELIRPWTRLRNPRVSGNELPVPDWGLTCPTCRRPLRGLPEHRCPQCGEAFDPQAFRPPGQWFVLDAGLCGSLPIAGVQALLAAEAVPYFPVAAKSLAEIYGGQAINLSGLRVPSEFFFEVLGLLQAARVEMAAARVKARTSFWICRGCGEENPGHFDICWNCQGARRPGR